ncbi:MAG: cell envelope integrity protein CreD [Synoicihabitans sp.]
MNESSPPPLPIETPPPLSAAKRLGNKLLVIAVCIVVLQIPLYFVEAKREERAVRQTMVVDDITRAWGSNRHVNGSVLVVPMKPKNDPSTTRLLFIAPAQLQITGDLKPDFLKRGIYEAQVYEADLLVEGTIRLPAETVVPDFDIDWSRARLVFALGSTKGLKVIEPLRWQDQEKSLSSISSANLGIQGLGDFVEVGPDTREYVFSLGVAVKGSRALDFSLWAADSAVSISSTSLNPSFQGAKLPDTRSVTPEGFEAEWTLGALDQSVPAVWIDSQMPTVLETAKSDAVFGVALLSGVTDYQSIERALKYGLLFLLTVFSGCFLGEFLGGRPLHVLNYLLVGAALCLFFLALLALAEVWGFGWAYLCAGLASTGLIVVYARAVMQRARAVNALGLVLGGIFSYLFLVLRLEDLSLLAGTVLLFLLLAAVMFATRHLQFEEISAPKEASA